MSKRLSGIFVDVSNVEQSYKSATLIVVRDAIFRNGAFKLKYDQVSSDIFAFDFQRKTTDSQNEESIREVNAFLIIHKLPVEIRAF